MNGERRVVVTGLGVASSIGLGVDAFWEARLQGRVGIAPIRTFDVSAMPSRLAAELPPFSLADAIPKTYRKSAKVMSRDAQIAVLCAYLAVRDAGLVTPCIVSRGEHDGPPNVDPARLGANVGAGLICADLEELSSALASAADENGAFSHVRWGREGMTNLTPLWLLKFLPNMLACHVTIVHDAQAISNTITCGEASGHLAIGEAYRTIARGSADAIICGGAESQLNPMALARLCLFGRLSSTADERPEQACRPFAPDARGTIAAEGGGLLILEELDHALKRGARIYAEVVGFGAGSQVGGWEGADPAGVCRAIEVALEDAGVTPRDIDLIICAGLGIPGYDAVELAAWRKVFGDGLAHIRAVANKGLVGCAGAGSGALDVAQGLLSLLHNTVPATPHAAALPKDLPLRFTPDGPKDAPLKRCISLAFSATGIQVAALIFSRWEARS